MYIYAKTQFTYMLKVNIVTLDAIVGVQLHSGKVIKHLVITSLFSNTFLILVPLIDVTFLEDLVTVTVFDNRTWEICKYIKIYFTRTLVHHPRGSHHTPSTRTHPL